MDFRSNIDFFPDSQGSLKCYQRDGNESIPGCEGIGEFGADYCYGTNAENLELTSGPVNVAHAGHCESGCLSYEDCKVSNIQARSLRFNSFKANKMLFVQLGHNCHNGNGTKPDADCETSILEGGSFCYLAGEEELAFMGDDGMPVHNFPLHACQGDCDNDWDCDVSLISIVHPCCLLRSFTPFFFSSGGCSVLSDWEMKRYLVA